MVVMLGFTLEEPKHNNGRSLLSEPVEITSTDTGHEECGRTIGVDATVKVAAPTLVVDVRSSFWHQLMKLLPLAWLAPIYLAVVAFAMYNLTCTKISIPWFRVPSC